MKRLPRSIPLTGHRTSTAVALGLAAACGLFVVPASHAQEPPPSAFVRTSAAQGGAADCQVTLPGGLKATVTRDGARLTDPAATGQTMLAFSNGGHQYLVPQGAAAQAGTKGLAAYDTTALAQRACGTDAFAPASARTAAAGHGSYAMGRLTVHLIYADSQPIGDGELFLIDVDNADYANSDMVFIASQGTLKVSVPVGHYEAVYVNDNHITVDPNVTVGDGSTLTLDARTSTHEIPVPATPRPAELTNTGLSIYASDGTPSGDARGLVLRVQRMGAEPHGFTLNSTAPAKRGRFTMVATADLASPADAPQPYAYHVANSYDHLPSSYPTSVDPKSLATVARTLSAPTGPDGIDLVVQAVTPVWLARGRGQQYATGFEFRPPGTERTEYISGSADLNWHTEVEDEQTHVRLTGKDTVYRAGDRRSEMWEADAPRPGVPVDTGSSSVGCGACADADTMVFGIGADSDSTPGTVGMRFDGDAGTVTLTRDGQLLASDTGSLYGVSVDVPPGRATYQLRQQTLRPDAALAPSTDTTWTFTAEPGKGRALPDRVPCQGLDAGCAALPLLFADTSTDADLQHRLTAGPHTVHLDVTREQYATGSTVTGATLQVSYDDGKSWQDLHVTGANGAFRAAYTVPADASGVSFKLAAWDAQGNRIDQVLPHAYEVR
ncbi:hypothetical protein [Streptomyces sp. NPDC020917]|uniref:hypothetical protein n=1 Tax=Streptomyces sp. NPDC020917 TaxID=3365102 RepID=UPI0037B5EE14